MKRVKQIGFAYASSVVAERFGFKDGCWYVSTRVKPDGLPKFLAGFSTIEKADAYAEREVKEPWDNVTYRAEVPKPIAPIKAILCESKPQSQSRRQD